MRLQHPVRRALFFQSSFGVNSIIKPSIVKRVRQAYRKNWFRRSYSFLPFAIFFVDGFFDYNIYNAKSGKTKYIKN